MNIARSSIDRPLYSWLIIVIALFGGQLIAVGLAAKNVHLEGRLRIQEYERRQIHQSDRLIGSSDVIKRLEEQIKLEEIA